MHSGLELPGLDCKWPLLESWSSYNFIHQQMVSRTEQVSLFRALSSALPWPQAGRSKVILREHSRHWALWCLAVTVCWCWHLEGNHSRVVVVGLCAALGGSGKVASKIIPVPECSLAKKKNIFLKGKLSFATCAPLESPITSNDGEQISPLATCLYWCVLSLLPVSSLIVN